MWQALGLGDAAMFLCSFFYEAIEFPSFSSFLILPLSSLVISCLSLGIGECKPQGARHIVNSRLPRLASCVQCTRSSHEKFCLSEGSTLRQHLCCSSFSKAATATATAATAAAAATAATSKSSSQRSQWYRFHGTT